MSFPFSIRRCARPFALALLLLAAWLPRIAAAQALYHVLEKGETLYSVARSYGVRPEAITKANSIDDPSKLRAGRRLLIPRDVVTSGVAAKGLVADGAGEATTYKVVKGDTLFSIARTFGVALEALRSANRLNAASVIRAGDELSIPAGGRAPPVRDPGPAALTSSASPDSVPAMPSAVRTSSKAVAKGVSWPCSGEILYLDGKAYGVVIRAKLGEAQKAIAAGTVSSAGPYRGYGNVVFVLTHGYIYVYGGNESLSVRAGDRITAGQELGRVGMDAKQGGPAAYFLVFRNGEAVDPAAAPRD
jgi:murein DD-endopeptidase MepM/ murein hydrolase activator NlpD